MNFKFSERSKQRREGVDPRLIAISDLALQISPLDFGIPRHGGLRTAEQQKCLFDAGKSKCDGTRRKSRHQSGKALDFYAFVDGKASWDREHLAIVAAAHLQAASMLGHQLQWGGLWDSFPDFPHLELLE
jgi:peptidoglycan LD-endopeptidase CwlK